MDLNEIQGWSTDGTWLGRLRVANHLFAEFEPVAELADGKWIKVQNTLSKFPKQGIVRAKKGDLGQGRVTGGLWVFGCTPSGMDRHQCLAVEPERAIPIVDLSWKSIADARRQLLEMGVSLPEHQGRQAVVLLHDDTCCVLRFEPHGQLFVARVPVDGIVDLCKADPAWKSAYPIGNTGFLPTRGIPTIEVVQRVDWSSDRDFLQKILERYRAAVCGYWGLGGKASEPAIRKLERALVEGQLNAAGTSDWDAIVDRMRGEWADISRAFVAVKEMGELLLESEPGKRLLEEIVERRREVLAVKIETELRSAIETSLSSSREELAALEREVIKEASRRDDLLKRIAALTREQADAGGAVRTARSALQDLRATAEELRSAVGQLQAQKVAIQAGMDETANHHDALAARIESLKTTLIEFQKRAQLEFEATGANNESSLQAVAARLESLLGENGNRVAPLLPAAMPPWWCPTSSGDVRQISNAELEKQLAEEAKCNGVLAEDLRLLDLFARSGEFVLLLGDQAEQTVRAYARAVSGGNIRTHALDPSAIGLDDLWRVPTTGRPTAFALAWHHAQVRSDTAVMLCLRDLDASPFHLWLASLAAALRSPYRPQNLLVVATASSASGQGEEYPGTELLRRHIVALEPRADPLAHLAEAVHDEPLAPPSMLIAPWESEQISQITFKTIARGGRDTEAIRRALRLCSVGGEASLVSASGLPSLWCQYLVDGRPETLAPALLAAHERLKTLHFQR